MQKISISWQVNKLTSRRVACYFIRQSSFFYLAFLQVDKFTSLQVDELLVILYANSRSFILCFFASWRVNKSTSIRVACYSIRKSSFFYSVFFASWRVNKSASRRVACYFIRQSSFFNMVFWQATCSLVFLFTRPLVLL